MEPFSKKLMTNDELRRELRLSAPGMYNEAMFWVPLGVDSSGCQPVGGFLAVKKNELLRLLRLLPDDIKAVVWREKEGTLFIDGRYNTV